MARIAGVDIPNKHVNIALTYIFGIGRSSAMKICKEANVNPDTPINDLPSEELNRLREIIDKEYNPEGSLRSQMGLSIQCLIEIGSYRGLRHRKGLPVRGQRTRTNSRTRKGKKKTVANKKKA